jgi:hypothetical protein
MAAMGNHRLEFDKRRGGQNDFQQFARSSRQTQRRAERSGARRKKTGQFFANLCVLCASALLKNRLPQKLFICSRFRHTART